MWTLFTNVNIHYFILNILNNKYKHNKFENNIKNIIIIYK